MLIHFLENQKIQMLFLIQTNLRNLKPFFYRKLQQTKFKFDKWFACIAISGARHGLYIVKHLKRRSETNTNNTANMTSTNCTHGTYYSCYSSIRHHLSQFLLSLLFSHTKCNVKLHQIKATRIFRIFCISH